MTANQTPRDVYTIEMVHPTPVAGTPERVAAHEVISLMASLNTTVVDAGAVPFQAWWIAREDRTCFNVDVLLPGDHAAMWLADVVRRAACEHAVIRVFPRQDNNTPVPVPHPIARPGDPA